MKTKYEFNIYYRSGAFIDSDDWIYPQYLELLLSAATENNTLIALCDYEPTGLPSCNFSEITNYQENVSVIRSENSYSLSHFPIIQAWAKIFHKSLISLPIRFPIGKINEDRYTTYQWVFSTPSITVINEKLYYYCLRDGSIMHTKWTPKRMDDLEACREQIEFFDKNGYSSAKNFVIKQYLSLMKEGFWQSGSYPEEHKKIKESFVSEFDKAQKIIPMSIKNNTDYYLIRYPFRTRIYCHFVSFQKVLKKSGVKGVFQKIKSKLSAFIQK